MRVDQIRGMVDAFAEQLDLVQLGFERAEPADTGRPGDDPRALGEVYWYESVGRSASIETSQFRSVAPNCSESYDRSRNSSPLPSLGNRSPIQRDILELVTGTQGRWSDDVCYRLCEQ